MVVVQVQWQVQYKLLGAGGRTFILNSEWTATIVTPDLRTQYHTRHTKENVVYDFSSQKSFDCVRDNLFKNTENQQVTKMWKPCRELCNSEWEQPDVQVSRERTKKNERHADAQGDKKRLKKIKEAKGTLSSELSSSYVYIYIRSGCVPDGLYC